MKKRYPITVLAGPCIPWTENNEVDEPSLRREIKQEVDNGITSMYFFGTAGEGYALTREKFTEITRIILDECAKYPGVEPMIGVISTSMPEMIERIGIAHELGAHDFQVALPCWGSLSPAEVRLFWREICGRFPDCRFMAYNNLPRTKTAVSVSEYVKIGDENPNFVAVKYSCSDIYQLYNIATANSELSFYVVDNGYLCASMFGQVGLISSFICLDSNAVWDFFNAGQNGDFETLKKTARLLFELNKAYACVESDLIDAAFDKSSVSVFDPDFSYRLHPPYSGLSKDEFDQMAAVTKETLRKYKAGEL